MALNLCCSGGLDGSVSVMTSHQSKLIVGGSFTVAMSSSASVHQCSGLAQWDPITARWGAVGSFGNSLPSGSSVSALISIDRTQLVVGGQFYHVGGLLANHVAIFKGILGASGPSSGSVTDEWATLGGGVGGGYVTSLAVAGEKGTLIYVGGTFTSVYSAAALPGGGAGEKGFRYIYSYGPLPKYAVVLFNQCRRVFFVEATEKKSKFRFVLFCFVIAIIKTITFFCKNDDQIHSNVGWSAMGQPRRL
jgi:hypothetical protein